MLFLSAAYLVTKVFESDRKAWNLIRLLFQFWIQALGKVNNEKFGYHLMNTVKS